VKGKLTLATAAAALLAGTMLAAPASAIDVNLEEVASGLTAPLGIAQPAGDERIFIFEQPGLVKILEGGEVVDEPFIDIRNRIVDLIPDFDERGLLGMAFHPDYANNGKFYLAYSGHLDPQGDLGKRLWWSHTNTVAEFTPPTIPTRLIPTADGSSLRSTGRSSITTATGSASVLTTCSTSPPVTAAMPMTGASATMSPKVTVRTTPR